MAVHCASENQQQLEIAVDYLAKFIRQIAKKRQAVVIGPADEAVAKVNDIYRKAIYLKHKEQRVLTSIKNLVEQYVEINSGFQEIMISFERK